MDLCGKSGKDNNRVIGEGSSLLDEWDFVVITGRDWIKLRKGSFAWEQCTQSSTRMAVSLAIELVLLLFLYEDGC